MEGRHGNCMENSSGKPPRNIPKKCYSLPVLQRENEKLKHDLNVLQAAYDEKEILLTESLLKVDLLDEQNNELKSLLKAAVVVNKEKVEMKDASTCVTFETKDESTSTSLVTVDSGIQVEMAFRVEMKDASTCVTFETKNESTSTSLVTVDSAIQVEMGDSTLSVTIASKSKNGSTSSSILDVCSEIKGDDEAKSITVNFDEIVRELPFDEKTEIIIFDKNLKELNISSNLKEHFQQIGGANFSKIVNNILNAIATKNLQKQFVWDVDASNSFQRLKNILSCIYSAVCSKENTQMDVNNIIKNALKNARVKW